MSNLTLESVVIVICAAVIAISLIIIIGEYL